MTDRLITALKQLRLSGLLQSLDVRLQEAAGNSLNHAEFLELILQDELAVRCDRQLQRRVKAASFRELKTLDDFDWSFNPSIKKKQIFDLAAGRFIRERRDVLLHGPARRRQEPSGPGHRLPRASRPAVVRAVPVDLRRGPRLPARRGRSAARTRSWPATSSPTCSSSTTWA